LIRQKGEKCGQKWCENTLIDFPSFPNMKRKGSNDWNKNIKDINKRQFIWHLIIVNINISLINEIILKNWKYLKIIQLRYNCVFFLWSDIIDAFILSVYSSSVGFSICLDSFTKGTQKSLKNGDNIIKRYTKLSRIFGPNSGQHMNHSLIN